MLLRPYFNSVKLSLDHNQLEFAKSVLRNWMIDSAWEL